LEGVTAEFIKSLTDKECERLLEAYSRGVLGFSRMGDVQGTPHIEGALYCREAMDDLRQSASQLTTHSPNYGFSRWASLQATEKVLKSFIAQQGKKFKKTHDLVELAAIAVSAGLPAFSPQLLDEIQCKAEVRYSAATVGKAEALQAHYAALVFCAQVAPRLKPQSGWITEIGMRSYEVNGKPRPMKALVVRRLKAA
jgi:HEPN domain-containing protein